jgi:hypothetical protein
MPVLLLLMMMCWWGTHICALAFLLQLPLKLPHSR